ncbi:hypothetical protein PTNB73_02550 [Pyrenophora teres f. teres]|nr:hypothetical protein PTNB73_02550 [Pyrenophora teres f. teres]
MRLGTSSRMHTASSPSAKTRVKTIQTHLEAPILTCLAFLLHLSAFNHYSTTSTGAHRLCQYNPRSKIKPVMMAAVVGSGGAGTKRKVGAVTVKKPYRKRQKTKPTSTNGKRSTKATNQCDAVHEVEVQKAEKPGVVEQDKVFRFLDLPGELRNRIYEVAIETSWRTFPLTHVKPKKIRGEELVERRLPLRPLPYIGLTQACSMIRNEFRPLWLSTHCFPLYVMDDYLKVFFPPPLRASQASEEVRKRIEGYYNPTGTLRLNINHNSLEDVDVQKLLWFQLRFPGYTITPTASCAEIPQNAVGIVSAVLNNKNPKWIKWLKRHVITQVRLRLNAVVRNRDSVRITMKSSHFPGWKSFCGNVVNDHDNFIDSLGLKDVGCLIHFGVEY